MTIIYLFELDSIVIYERLCNVEMEAVLLLLELHGNNTLTTFSTGKLSSGLRLSSPC